MRKMEFNIEKLISMQNGENLGTQQKILLTELTEFFLERDLAHKKDPKIIEQFLTPFLLINIPRDAVKEICLKIPRDFFWDHREMYFDFRLARWIKHVEPSSLKECMEEYWENSESPLDALKYFRGLIRDFSSRI